jgi:copper chaperone
MNSIIFIQNLKCGGCAKTITNNLSAIPTVENIVIDIANNSISLSHNLEVLDKIKQVLRQSGYPEQGENNNLIDKAKSYISCAVGKF